MGRNQTEKMRLEIASAFKKMADARPKPEEPKPQIETDIETPQTNIIIPKKKIHTPKEIFYKTSLGFDTKLIYLPKPIAARIEVYTGDRVIYGLLIRKWDGEKLRFSLDESGYERDGRARRMDKWKFTDLYKTPWLEARGKVELDGIQETLVAGIDRIKNHLGLTELIID